MMIEELVQKYHYKPLNKELSAKQRQLYLADLPKGFLVEGNLNCKL